MGGGAKAIFFFQAKVVWVEVESPIQLSPSFNICKHQMMRAFFSFLAGGNRESKQKETILADGTVVNPKNVCQIYEQRWQQQDKHKCLSIFASCFEEILDTAEGRKQLLLLSKEPLLQVAPPPPPH